MKLRELSLAWIATIAVPLATWAAEGPGRFLKRPDAWFASPEARRFASHILSHQTDRGDWPKNLDTSAGPHAGDRDRLKGTFDNGATTDELRFLARFVGATDDDRARAAFLKGLDHILKAQYVNGGWPQSFPPGAGYPRHITFNDNTMIRLMEFLREVGREDRYTFVDAERRASARVAFDRGVSCILRCQVVVDGRRTAWCAQHDEVDFQPRPARSFEPVALSGAESVGVVRLLMSLDRPSPEVIEAVDAAVSWFRAVPLTGMRQEMIDDPKAPTGKDKVVVDNPDAPPLWARFYEIGTNRPLYADRDGTIHTRLADLSHERRNGYGWLGTWPQNLLERDHPLWKRRLADR